MLSREVSCLATACVAQLRAAPATDSQYVRQGITEWIHNWKKRGWQTADRKPVKNDDLWRALDAEAARHQVHWHWVKGHAGDQGNERADALANAGAARYAGMHHYNPTDPPPPSAGTPRSAG